MRPSSAVPEESLQPQGGLLQRHRALLDAYPSRVWKADAIAEALEARKRAVQELLSELNAVDRIHRIGRGRYVSVKADLSRFRMNARYEQKIRGVHFRAPKSWGGSGKR